MEKEINKQFGKRETNGRFQKGYNVIRIWENEIKKMDINKFKNKIGGKI